MESENWKLSLQGYSFNAHMDVLVIIGINLLFKLCEEEKTSRLSEIGVAATSRPELVFFLVVKTSTGTSDVVGY